MSYIKIKVKRVISHEDLGRWEEHMLEKAKCWNNFCLGIYNDNELRAVHVKKEGNSDNVYLTTLCEDCIKNLVDYELLVNENHLMVESPQYLQSYSDK